ncbi:MAG: hypothetical protein N3H30_02265 [Candidatus Micrarchaeota archaeon]|nr:hypothetical protein [Candidatus Micrarchaeota archaeon]
MEYEVADSRLASELESRYIGYRREGKYYVDALQAAYLTEIGKGKFEGALERIVNDAHLKRVYAVFSDLRKNLHVCNYVWQDDVILVHEKGMVPGRAESTYMVKVVEPGIGLAEMLALRDTARRVRKTLMLAVISEGGKPQYYKFQEAEF